MSDNVTDMRQCAICKNPIREKDGVDFNGELAHPECAAKAIEQAQSQNKSYT